MEGVKVGENDGDTEGIVEGESVVGERVGLEVAGVH